MRLQKVCTKNLIKVNIQNLRRIFWKSLHVFLSFCMNIFFLIWGNHIKFLFPANSECKGSTKYKRNSFKSCKSKSLIFQYSSINRRWNLLEIPHKVQNWSPNEPKPKCSFASCLWWVCMSLLALLILRTVSNTWNTREESIAVQTEKNFFREKSLKVKSFFVGPPCLGGEI